MFDLATTAQDLVDRLVLNAVFGTVAFIEDDDESMRYPVELPAAFVVLDKLDAGGKAPGTVTCGQVWAVILRSQKLLGSSGCLPLVDQVIDELTGYKPSGSVKPLQFAGVQLYDKKYASVAYLVRFSTDAVGQTAIKPCG